MVFTFAKVKPHLFLPVFQGICAGFLRAYLIQGGFFKQRTKCYGPECNRSKIRKTIVQESVKKLPVRKILCRNVCGRLGAWDLFSFLSRFFTCSDACVALVAFKACSGK